MSLLPQLSTWAALSSTPSEFRILCLGDSTTDDNNPGIFDGASVSAGITCFYKTSTEYSTTGTTTWANPNSGLYSNLCERALLRSGVTSVKCITEAISGSRFITHKRDQLTDAKQKWAAEGWDAPHLCFIGGIVNDLTANGTGVDGEWNGGDAITAKTVKQRLQQLVMRVRATAGWGNVQIVFLIPMMENSDYPQADDLATWITAAVADWSGVSAIDARSYRVLLNSKHIDADADPGGNNDVADQVLDEISVLT